MIYQIQYSTLYELADLIREKTHLTSTFTFPMGFISAMSNINFFDYSMASTVLVFNKTSTGYAQIDASQNLILSNNTLSIWPSSYFNYVYISLPKVKKITAVSTSQSVGNTALKLVNLSQCQEVGARGLQYEQGLSTIILPECQYIRSQAFNHCSKLQAINFSKCTIIEDQAFYDCTQLKLAYLPNCTSIGSEAFYRNLSLENITIPNCINIGNSAFANCQKLIEIDLINCQNIDSCAFMYCRNMHTAKLYNVSTINSSCFYGCSNLASLYIYNSQLVPMSNSNALFNTAISISAYTGNYGSIYVPASLISEYQNATQWTVYSSRFVPLQE